MTYTFETEKAAQDFIKAETKYFSQVQTKTLFTNADGIISQLHFSFHDFNQDIRHRYSILEKKVGFEVTSDSIKYSTLVFAAEVGDLDLFKKEFAKGPTGKALSLAFSNAVFEEHLNILQYYYDAGIIKRLSLFKDPLVMASRGDRFSAFHFFIRKGLQLPEEILGPLFYDNSIKILQYLIDDPVFSKQILEHRFCTSWAIRELGKNNNESTRMFMTHSSQN